MVAKSSPVSMQEQLQASANQIWTSMKKLEQTMKASPDKGNSDGKEGAPVSLESVIRIMFVSCTSGMNTTPEDDSNEEESDCDRTGSRKMSQSTPEPASPTNLEENIYKNLFEDDHIKAEDAICHLREQMEQQRNYRSPPRNISTQPAKEVPSLFPVSSPKEKQKANQPPAKVLSAPAEDAGNDISFDDEISAISQHTLEELAALRQGGNGFLERVHSDVTQDPAETLGESWKKTVEPKRQESPQRMSSPLRFQRTGRSHGTLNTKHTMGTKSTMSSQTEFASVFRKDEQRYWQDVVQEQDESQDLGGESIGISSRHEKLIKARERIRRRELKGRQDGTSTTVNSSVYSGRNSHDHAVKVLSTDPDRFMDVVVLPPGTEIGEI